MPLFRFYGVQAFEHEIQLGDLPDELDLTSPPYSIGGYTGSGLGYRVHAGGGDDVVYGTQHLDYIDGENGRDTAYGNGGDDFLYGGIGGDFLYGGPDYDQIHGGDDNDTLEGNGGGDQIWGDAGDDVIYGDNNQLSAELGGNPSGDLLHGGDGNDTIHGQEGVDQIWGDRGNDTLWGGAGADRFVFAARDVYLKSYTTLLQDWTIDKDTIKDFEASGANHDVIDLSALLDVHTPFEGSAAEAIAQGYIYWKQSLTRLGAPLSTTVYVDLDGGAHEVNPSPFAGQPDLRVVQLDGVAASQINASLFIV